ncbi:hypothetical protein GGI12_001314 [Dipsacomyces acuminosporus]|nr:hypothetical protein GGI12_001314 [Dipsacomyces acuminosporus]
MNDHHNHHHHQQAQATESSEDTAVATASGQDALLPNGLTQAQQASLNKALEYARELQQTVFKGLLDAEQKRMEEQSKPPLGQVNPGLEAGVDARNLSVMSRVYVGSINFELTEEHIYKVFAEFGTVRSVSMSKDPITGRHKGFGFVEYEVPEAATLAVEVMNGTMLGGRQLKIGRPNNYNMAVMQGFPQPPMERIYVANVNEAISEDSLKEIFAPFGEIKVCILAPDIKARRHKGWGFIEFAEAAAADQAAMAMNGFSLGNLVLRVRKCVVGGPLGQGMSVLDSLPADAVPSPTTRLPQQVMEVAASINRSIAAETALSGANSNPQIVLPTDPSMQAVQQDIVQKQAVSESPVVLLTNIVGDRSEVDDDLAGDVAEEGDKCGRIVKVVVHIATDQELQQSSNEEGGGVKIFVQYAESESAAKAVELFDGRWFGGRKVSASLYDPDTYRVETSSDTMVYIP